MIAAPEDGPAAAPLVPVSWGELFDKITILELKADRLDGATQRANVGRELDALRRVRAAAGPATPALAALIDELRVVNAALWEIEEELRALEAAGSFGRHFIGLARQVYTTNDRRAAIKRAINAVTGSALVEEKSHPLTPPILTPPAPSSPV